MAKILKIQHEVKVENKFKFADSTPYSIQNERRNLDPKKASTEKDLPTKILIGSSDKLTIIYLQFITMPKMRVYILDI